eukprot:jgi/Mesen1/7869/ME000042S07311
MKEKDGVEAVAATFEALQKAQISFANSVAELTGNQQNARLLREGGVTAKLRALLLAEEEGEPPLVQQAAVFALGRLANANDELALDVVHHNLLPKLVMSLCEDLASCVVETGAVGLLVLCAQDNDLLVKRSALSALSDVAKHSPRLARAVVDVGTVAHVAPLLTSMDSKLKRQACLCLGQIARHSGDLAKVVAEDEAFPAIMVCLKDFDELVRKNAATTIREIAKHTAQLAHQLVGSGAVGALIDYVVESPGTHKLPGVMALGYIAAFSESSALAVIVSKGVPPLVDSLVFEAEDQVRTSSAWALSQIGCHGPDHAKAVAQTGALLRMVSVCSNSSGQGGCGEELRGRCLKTLRCIVERLTSIPSLDALLQLAKVLPNDAEGRSKFVSSGGFAKVQKLNVVADTRLKRASMPADESQFVRSDSFRGELTEADSMRLKESVDAINMCYPFEIVQYYSPEYSKKLLEKLTSSMLVPSSAAA